MSNSKEELRSLIQELETSATNLEGDEFQQAFRTIRALSQSPHRLRLTEGLIIEPDWRVQWASPEPVPPIGSGSGSSSSGTPTSSGSGGTISKQSGSFKCPHCHKDINFSV